jgi:hypothetical protein
MKWLCPHCNAINPWGPGVCHNCVIETPLSSEFDHPCRDYCSGWKQGEERGFFRAIERLKQKGFWAAVDELNQKEM